MPTYVHTLARLYKSSDVTKTELCSEFLSDRIFTCIYFSPMNEMYVF